MLPAPKLPAHIHTITDQKQVRGKCSFGLYFQIIVYHWGKLEQELKACMGFFLDRKGGQVGWTDWHELL